MKTATRTGCRAAIFAGVAALAIATLLMAPPVQRALVRRALIFAGSTSVDLGDFHADPSGLASGRIDVAFGSLRISGRSIVVRLDPAKLLTDRRLEVTELSGRDVEISWDANAAAIARTPQPGGPQPPQAAAPPRFVSVALHHADLAGRFVARRGQAVLQRGEWRVAGGGLAPGVPAEFDYSASWRAGDISAGAAADSRGKIRLTEGRLGILGNLGIELDADFDLPEASKIRPELGVVGRIHGRVQAAGEGKGGSWTLTRARVVAGGSDPNASLEVELGESLPIVPWRMPDHERMEVRFSRIPLEWVNPWIGRSAPARIAFGAGSLDGSASVALVGGVTRLQSLRAAVNWPERTEPIFTVTLAQALPFTRQAIKAYWEGAASVDIAAFRSRDFPLALVSRWLPPGHAIEGRLAEGSCVLRSVKGRGFVLETTEPWKVEGFRLIAGNTQIFGGNLLVSPRLVCGRDEIEARLVAFDGTDVGGNHLHGGVGLRLRTRNGALAADTNLVLDIPSLPHSEGTFGPLRISFSAAGEDHPEEHHADFSTFEISVAARGRRLIAITADRPVRVQRTTEAEWLLSSPEPLRFETASFPLAWCNPYLASKRIVLEGVLRPTEMKLWLSQRHARLASTRPISIADFRLERRGAELLERGLLRFGADVDLALTHRLLPDLRFAYSAVLAITDGATAAAGSEVARFGVRIGLRGDEKQRRLTGVAGSFWTDLGAFGRIPALRGARLPARGELTVDLSEVPDRTDAVQIEAHVRRLAGRDGRDLPDLDVSGRVQVEPGKRVGALRVQAVLHSKPRPSDANFVLSVDNRELSVLDSTSVLRSSYLDFDDLGAFLSAFSPARLEDAGPAAAEAPDAPPGAAAAPALGPKQPAWGGLRGSFTLDVKTLAFGGYRISDLSGRLGLTADTLSLTSLSGEIFGAQWSAALTARFRPGDPAGDHQLTARFQLRQLDAARLVAQRFPEEAPRVDARIDVALSVSSQASRLDDLFAHAAGEFSLAAGKGTLRLSLPGQEMRSSIALLGTLTFSPELRALSRLIGELSEMPLNHCDATGELAANGRLSLDHLHVDAPQLKIDVSGTITDAKAPNLAVQPLTARALLATRGDMAVILGGMGLLGRPGADGFRPVTEPFDVAGTVGQPDLHGLYNLLARAVSGSQGTWGLLMRTLQDRIGRGKGGAPPRQP